MLTDEMKEVALRVAGEVYGTCATGQETEFAERFLAALPKPEPIAWLRFWAGQICSGNGNIEHDEGLEVTLNKTPGDDGSAAFPVYAEAPKDTAAIEQRVAEACRKAVLSERLEGPTDSDGDIAYEHAIDDASKAINKWREFL